MSLLDKQTLRLEAKRRRRQQTDAEEISRRITRRLIESDPYASARTVLWYLHVRDEVKTIDVAIEQAAVKCVAVPYCVEGRLQLFHLQSREDLARGAFGILEPEAALREDPARRLAPEEVDLVVTPGLAFDLQGGRLGYGQGYYDKLLPELRRDALLTALAYESQLFPKIPTSAHDVPMHWIVTEQTIHVVGEHLSER